jgi:uncharacterized protein (TIGR02145 family)
MKKITLLIVFFATSLIGMSQSKTMIVYRNGVKCYEALVTKSDSIAFNAVDTAMDVDGNVYRTIKIGNKLWMVDNLRTTKLNDGTPIPNITTDNINFANGVSGVLRTTPAYCWFNNLAYNKPIFGGLYNWFAVETRKLAPAGWRVATKEDWAELEVYLAANGYNFDGTKSTDGSVSKIMKSMASETYWMSSAIKGAIGNDIKANNKSGLSILPGGYRDGLTWAETGSTTGCWTGSFYDASYANSRFFSVNDSGMLQSRTAIKQMAFSVRCVKDIVVAPVAGLIPDSHFASLKTSFATRRDAAFEAMRYTTLAVKPIDSVYVTTTGCPLSRDFSYSLSDYAFKSLWLNANVDKANAALVQNADLYLTYPSYLKDRDSFYWSADEWLRLLEYYGSKGSKAAGRITAATEAKLYELMFLYMNTWSPATPNANSPINCANYTNNNTWYIDGTENHQSMQSCTFWHFCKLLKDNPTYASQKFPDGTTPEQIFNITGDYLKHWVVERAKKGLFIETANDDYNQETLKGYYNLYDFAPDAELRELSGKLLDLYWATWAQEQLKGVRGGSKARIYRGNQSNGYDGSGGRIFGYKMAYYYLASTVTYTLSNAMFTAVTSEYRMPNVVMDIALMRAELGDFEIKDRTPGLALSSGNNANARQDYGGIVRYSYCTPDFIMGTMHLEARPELDWMMISSQNRWQGVIFDGDPLCRIYPQAQTEYRAYNQHWSVQNKGCMITQQLPEAIKYSKYTDSMRVYFSGQGLTSRIEKSGWVFVASSTAYAAVKCVTGTYHWLVGDTRWMVCNDRYSPVVIEVGQKADYASYTAFQDKVIALPLTYDGKVLKHTSIYNDKLEFYTDRSSLPKVNGTLIDLRPTNVFDSPFIKSVFNSGVVEISKNQRKLVLDFTLK